MCQISVNIPEGVLYDIKMTKSEFAAEARKFIAIKFYTDYGVSLGYSAEIAGMDKEEFIRYLGTKKISIFHFDNKEEFLEELQNA